jgi:phospholipid/cholesterol/gamma-HCH transport system substrate-binding protein
MKLRTFCTFVRNNIVECISVSFLGSVSIYSCCVLYLLAKHCNIDLVKLSQEVKVGLLATVALTIVYLGSNFLKGRDFFSSNNSYYTIYDNCQGLGTSSPVLLNGMSVGRIKRLQIIPNKEHSVLVTFETTKDIKLTDATKTRLISPSLLGNKAIELIIAEGNPLKNYDTVPGQTEQGFGDLFLDQALPTLKDAHNISSLASQFVANLIENTGKINSIFANLEDTTRQLKQTIYRNQQAFDALSKNMSEASNALADSKDGVRPLLTKLNQLMAGVEGSEAKELPKKLYNILGSIEKILDRTEQGESSLSHLLYDDLFYNNLNQTIGNLDKLIIDLKAHPWRYVNFSFFGKRKGYKEVKKE